MKNLTIAFLAAASLFTVSACKKKGGGDAGEAVAKMENFTKDMCACKDKACADKVQEGMTKWSTDMAAKGGEKKDEKPDEATMKKMTEVGQKYAECMTKAMTPADGAAPTGSDPATGSAAAADPAAAGGAAAAGDLPAECNDYKAAIEALAKCDKLPQQTRDALKQSYEQTSTAWASVPAEGKAALATACKSAADAVKQSAAACN
ncbi:MAG: hypothetical protein H0T42_30335 [Deltaproteobacteria bacterium]|nr:hypothetical protein [Deltaproteobacteria bacterium]